MATAGEAQLMDVNGIPGQLRYRDDILVVLSKPDPLADLIIDVEGYQLYTSKYLLASASSKFREMFVGSADGSRQFLAHSADSHFSIHQPRAQRRHSYPLCRACETTTAVTPHILPLPDLSLNDVIDMLRWLLPTETLNICAENVEAILNLANECGIEKLLEACDRYYYEKLESSTLDEDFMEYVAVAQRNGLSLAKELAVNHLSRLTTKELSELGDSLGVTTGAMAEIFKRRSELLESGRLAPGNVYLPENFVLVVGDKALLVPSSALAVASDVLKVMMESDFIERKTGQINMSGKSYEAVKFMVEFITSKDHVPIPNEHLVECIGLADEYMIGRLRHACIQCMISNAHKLELNERLLYLRLVYKYQLPEVEEKIVNWFCQRPTADILQCENYDIFSAAPLLLRRAQWLETELVRHQERIDSILSQAMELYTDLDKCVIGMLGRLTKAMNESNTPGQQCSSGHCISSGYSYNSNYSAVYISTCCHCALLSRQQFSNTLSIANGYTSLETTETQIINGERQVKKTESNFSWPCFSSNMKMKFDQLKWQGVIMPPPRCVPPRIDNAI